MLSAIACPLNLSRDLLKMIRAFAFEALDKHWTYGYSVVRPATTNKGIKNLLPTIFSGLLHSKNILKIEPKNHPKLRLENC